MSILHPMSYLRRYRPGFTFIELLLVIAVIAIMIFLNISAVSPGRQIDQVKDIERKRSANQIQQALYEYLISNDEFPVFLPGGKVNAKPICREGITDISCINLDGLIPDYRPSLPLDSAETDPLLSGYSVYTRTGRATVTANHLED